ncbi:nuclear fragile X mental retardation-interacting protein 1 [Syngnathoides biaculeatus]|uniref:nuclear fragile X mental retardation-interacting protein 1 n=1 Tax=Syngnathoides biaculeatus TaxID=300417 RepID=UPI002ADD6698|nr:nuclear fragile X mental retardation-interacting protein 1 [Syngnathoides biaculeatus]
MCSMEKPGFYPPPDFDCPPPSSIQASRPQQPVSKSNFHPSMWTWSETPSEPTWAQSSQASWYREPASGPALWSPNIASQSSYGRDWYHSGQQSWSNYGPTANHGKRYPTKKEPNFVHFCDTCDRGFKNQEKYEEHVAQHVECSVPDCKFMAHEKIVSIHWRNTHAPGMKRIKLDTAEEIAKWREERRKNYPTLQNVEKKRKLMEEREKTGAVLETAQFGRMRSRGRGRWRGRGHHRFQGQQGRGPHPSDGGAAADRPPPLDPASQNGDPLGVLAKSDIDSDKDDADTESKTACLVVAPKQMTVALGSLVTNYGSMSESEGDEGEQDSTIQKGKDLLQENKDLLGQKNGPFTDGETITQGTQASKVSCPWSALNTSNNQRGRGRRGGRRGRAGHHNIAQTRRPTLLEMLLAPDIRHERNVLLQCVRYVVRNDFFGLEPKPQRQLMQATGSSDREAWKENRTLSDTLVGGEMCSVKGGTSSHRATGSGATCKEDDKEVGPSNVTSETTVQQNLSGNCLDKWPLDGQGASGAPDDKAVPDTPQNQSGPTPDQAGAGSPCDQTVFPDNQGDKATQPSDCCLSTQKNKDAPVDSLTSGEPVSEDKEEMATTYEHSHDSVAPYESRSTNSYEDEIWEMSN